MENLSPTVRNLSEHTELEREYKLWSTSRKDFNATLLTPGSKAAEERWQKSYFRGLTPSGQEAGAGHRSKLRLKPFKPKG